MRNSKNFFIGRVTKRIFNTTVKVWETEHSSWWRKGDSRTVTLYKFVDYHIGPPIMHWGPMSHPSESSKCVFMKIHFIGLVRKFSDPNILERQLPWTYENGQILILPPWHPWARFQNDFESGVRIIIIDMTRYRLAWKLSFQHPQWVNTYRIHPRSTRVVFPNFSGNCTMRWSESDILHYRVRHPLKF